jgi:sugar/nucleoside kinase (ribokinase family)
MNKKLPVFRIVSIGDLVTDIIVRIPSLPVLADHHQPTYQLRLEPGGAGNFLIAGQRLGMQMVALGVIGTDPFGSASMEVLAAEGVKVGEVIRQTGTSGTNVIVLVDDAGRHVFLGSFEDGPSISLPEAWIREIDNAQAVFVSGYFLQEKRITTATLQAMEYSHQRGVPVFFDPGPNMASATAREREVVLACSDVLLLTEEEIPFLAGKPGISSARALISEDIRLICVKRGPQGCVLIDSQGQVTHPGFKVSARDTTAAGDSFAAAFIFAWLKGWSLEKIAAFANAMGAAKVQKIGSGSQVPTADEVRRLLEAHGLNFEF